MPVAFAMALVGFLGFAHLTTLHAAQSMVVGDLFSTLRSYPLTVIPLFIFMGQISFHAGISRRLFKAAHAWFGGLPGGLGMATVGACTAFGAICGSGPATAATMATVALPEMKRYNYDMELGTGAVAAGGSLGMLIPPSVVFIVYGIMTEQSVGRLFVAGILPGLLIALLFCLTIYINCRLHPHLGPAAPAASWKVRFRSLLATSETLLIFAVVMFGLFAGFFTPTEAGAIGAVATLILAILRRQLSWQGFQQALKETARTSCMVIIIVAGAMIFGRFLAVSQIPVTAATWLSGLPLPRWTIMSMIIVFFFLGGCFVDALALILLTIPVFFPVIQALNYDPVWFGVIIVIITQMGVISPPVGVNVYVVSGIERDVPLQTIFRGALPFMLALVIGAILLVSFPQLSLALPNLMK
jgi:tripartite ATP-independent transporter DctM subunit